MASGPSPRKRLQIRSRLRNRSRDNRSRNNRSRNLSRNLSRETKGARRLARRWKILFSRSPQVRVLVVGAPGRDPSRRFHPREGLQVSHRAGGRLPARHRSKGPMPRWMLPTSLFSRPQIARSRALARQLPQNSPSLPGRSVGPAKRRGDPNRGNLLQPFRRSKIVRSMVTSGCGCPTSGRIRPGWFWHRPPNRLKQGPGSMRSAMLFEICRRWVSV